MNGRMRRLIRKHFRYSNKVEKCYTSISAFTIYHLHNYDCIPFGLLLVLYMPVH